MKKMIGKKENILYIVMFFLLVIVHFPILTKNLLTADVLLNNSYYNGYSWELSLGRFGLFGIGLLKSYLSVSTIETFLSFLLIGIITYLLMNLFEIDSKVQKLFLVLLMVLSPIISSTLLFTYCSVPYLLAFLCGILSLFLFYKTKKWTTRFLLPIFLMVISLSMYQAYLSLIVTVFVCYQLKLLLAKKISYQECGIYVLLILTSMIVYFMGMKITQLLFHVSMASYSNASRIGINTILDIPHKLIESYQLFFQMFFTNEIEKNTYLGNPILYSGIGILFLISFGITLWKSKLSWKEKVLSCIILFLFPVFLNCVIFVIAEAKLQLLMSSSYLILPFFFLPYLKDKKMMVLTFLFLGVLFRNYLIQDQATYLTLENTYKAYDTAIRSAIDTHINELDKPFIVVGNIHSEGPIANMNYGYIADEGIFWDEYHLRKLGFERFCQQEYGLTLTFGDEEIYEELLDHPTSELIYEYKDHIVINLYQYI